MLYKSCLIQAMLTFDENDFNPSIVQQIRFVALHRIALQFPPTQSNDKTSFPLSSFTPSQGLNAHWLGSNTTSAPTSPYVPIATVKS